MIQNSNISKYQYHNNKQDETFSKKKVKISHAAGSATKNTNAVAILC